LEPFLQISQGPGGPVLSTLEGRLLTFFLIFVRCIALIASAPILNSRSVDRLVKGGLALGISLVVEAALPAQQYTIVNYVSLILLVFGEMLIGFMMGFTAQIFYQAVGLAGEVIGQQAGFAIATALDPATEQDSALMEQVLLMITTLVILVSNMHLAILQILAETFRVVPPGSVVGLNGLGKAGETIAATMSGAGRIPGFFEFAVRLAAPAVIALIALNVADGIMAKTSPQVNIMVIGFALRLVCGLFILIVTMPTICLLIHDYLALYPHWARTVMSWLRA